MYVTRGTDLESYVLQIVFWECNITTETDVAHIHMLTVLALRKNATIHHANHL